MQHQYCIPVALITQLSSHKMTEMMRADSVVVVCFVVFFKKGVSISDAYITHCVKVSHSKRCYLKVQVEEKSK